jgi:hypothetical protein
MKYNFRAMKIIIVNNQLFKAQQSPATLLQVVETLTLEGVLWGRQTLLSAISLRCRRVRVLATMRA